MNLKKEIRSIEGIGLSTSLLLSETPKPSFTNAAKNTLPKTNRKLMSFEKKYNLLDVPRDIGQHSTEKILHKSFSPCRRQISSKQNKMHDTFDKSYSLASSKQASQTNLQELNTSRQKAKLPITLLKTKSSNWLQWKKPNQEILENLQDRNSPIKKTENKIKLNLPEKTEIRKSDIEKLLESQQQSKRRSSLKENREIPALNLCDLSCIPIPERSGRSEDSPIKRIENEKPKRLTNSSTSRSRLNKGKLPITKLQKIFKDSAKGEKVLEDIANYEDMFPSSQRRPIRKRLFTPSKKENLSFRISDDNYQEMSMRALKNTSFFAEKIMKQIRCSSRLKNA